MADYWPNIFEAKQKTTTEHDIEHCIGEEASNNTLKISDEMEKSINIDDLDKVVSGLKTNKAPGTSGFTNEFYREFHYNLKLRLMDYIYFTKATGKLSFLQRQG